MDQRNWYQGPVPRSPASPSPGAPPGQTAVSGSCWLGADSASVVTPESAGDVVFKLSLRRKKKKHRDNKERKWPGPAPPVSPVRSLARGLAPQGQPATQASSCGRGGLGQRPWVWETQGEVVPQSMSPWESEGHQHGGGRKRVRRKRPDEPRGTCCPSMWAAGTRGHSCLLSVSHRWAVGASRWVEAQREKGSHSL